jgi:DNA-binding transcriptional LysR family regulator
MELQQLRYLHAVVRTGSVTAAAAAEYVSQPSVSKQMRQLERELGVALFHRVGRRVVPTEAALALAEMAERIFDDLASTVAQISTPGEGKGLSLRVCATETVSDYLLPGVLAEWRERYPKARISVEMLGSEAAVEEVVDGAADLALVVLPIQDSRLDVAPVLDEAVLLTVPVGHGWAERPSVSMAEALNDPQLVLSMRGIGLRSLVEAAASELGAEPAGRIELRSLHATLAMVARGAGVAFAPAMALEGRTDVVGIRLEPKLSRSVGRVQRKGRKLSPVGVALIELLEAEAARRQAKG